MQVTIVLDPLFGERPDPAPGPAFWLVDTPANRALAERLWATHPTEPNSAVFRSDGPADEEALRIFPEVCLHHPEAKVAVFIGVHPDGLLAATLRDEGYGVRATPDGLKAERADGQELGVGIYD